jgi:hypothetical protein
MAYIQFEMDLTHLEQIVPHLAPESPLGLAYWRGRVASLLAHPGLGQIETRRVERLASLLDEIDRASKS